MFKTITKIVLFQILSIVNIKVPNDIFEIVPVSDGDTPDLKIPIDTNIGHRHLVRGTL